MVQVFADLAVLENIRGILTLSEYNFTHTLSFTIYPFTIVLLLSVTVLERVTCYFTVF